MNTLHYNFVVSIIKIPYYIILNSSWVIFHAFLKHSKLLISRRSDFFYSISINNQSIYLKFNIQPPNNTINNVPPTISSNKFKINKTHFQASLKLQNTIMVYSIFSPCILKKKKLNEETILCSSMNNIKKPNFFPFL